MSFCRLLFLTWLEDPGGGTDRWTKNTVLHSERTRAGGNKQKGKNVFGGGGGGEGGFHTVHGVGDI